MKKTLLFVSAIMASSFALADDWVAPVYSGGYLSLNEAEGQTVHLYNTGAHLFLGEGNEWGTHATVALNGNDITIKKATDEEWDGVSYIISNYCQKKNGNYNMFITDGGNAYMDASATATDYYFSFNDLGSNTYSICGSPLNPAWNTTGDMNGYLLGVYTKYINNDTAEETGTGVIYDYAGLDNNYGPGEFLTTWAIVSDENYQTYLAEVKRYDAALDLGRIIENVLAEGLKESDIAQELAIYRNTSSTVEDIEAASGSIYAKRLQYYEKNVTPDTPKLIVEDDCSDLDYWITEYVPSSFKTGSWIDEGNWEAGFVAPYLDIWDSNLKGEIYQDQDNLPNGIYVIKIGALSQSLEGEVFANENKMAVPADNKGHFYTITTEVTDGTLKYGYRQTAEGTNWVVIDEVNVQYYGSGVEAYRYWLSNLLESAPDFSEATAQSDLIEEYEGVLASVNTAKTKEEILSIIPAYEEILNRINTNVAAYDELKQALTNADNLTSDEKMNSYYGEQLGDAIQEKQNVVEEHTADTEGVKTAKNELQSIIDEAQNYVWNVEKLANEVTNAEAIDAEYGSACSLEASMAYDDYMTAYNALDYSKLTNADIEKLLNDLYKVEFDLQVPATPASDDNPVDYTAKIFNPTYSSGADGWTNEGWSTCGNNTGWYGFDTVDGALGDDHYLNLWGTTAAKVSQTITDLPNGTYSVKVGAYADNAGFQVFANDGVLDVRVGQTESYQRGEWYEIIVAVTDGTLCIGAENTVNAESWAMIDNWQLTYYGKDSEKTPTDITGMASETKQSDIYSITGMKMGKSLNGLQKGIYIKDGKKFYVK